MKKIVPALLGLSLVSVPPTTGALWGERETLVEPETIVGSPVRNTDGKDLGKIKQLLIDPEEGEIAYAVVARGGVVGLGEETVVISWDAFEVTGDSDKEMVLTLDMIIFEIDELE